MSGWALNCCFWFVSPQKCDSRVPLPLCQGVGRESPAGLGEKAADAGRCRAMQLCSRETRQTTWTCVPSSAVTRCARQSSFQGTSRDTGLRWEWGESQCPATGLLRCLLGSPVEQLGLEVPSWLCRRREAPSQLRDVAEARRMLPREMPFSLSSCW